MDKQKTDLKVKKDHQNKLEELQAKCDEYLNGWKRAKADYENFKKESEKRVTGLVEFATAGMILEILPVHSHFKLALEHVPEDDKKAEWVQGIMHIKREFEDFFKKLDIVEIKTIGEKFNPEFHEAVSHEESDQEDDIIIKEVQPGYMLKEQVIQPAKVVVSKLVSSE
ncbi:nucleotide exchange factor GrpE [Patescibacteria group bacterium]|nr:nucleotide exchange factor GrpE [Patescibacteria group bacterium]